MCIRPNKKETSLHILGPYYYGFVLHSYEITALCFTVPLLYLSQDVIFGVPQGLRSVLGSVLFLLYRPINDITDTIHSNFLLITQLFMEIFAHLQT